MKMAAPKNDIVVSTAALDKIAEEYSLAACMGSEGRFKQMMLVSSGIKRLRNALTPEILNEIAFLQGSTLGFLTDKDKDGGYKDLNVLRNCVLEATMRGAMVCGNEFNIISARPYFTKAYFERVLRQFPNLTNLKVQLSVPKLIDGRQVVHASCSWKLKGVADSLELDLPIKVNAGMGDDAILGKARRKALAQIFGQITGSPLDDAEVGEAALKPANLAPEEEEKPQTKSQALRQKLKAIAPPPQAPAKEDLTPPGSPPEMVTGEPADPYLVTGKIVALDADPDGPNFCVTIGARDMYTSDPAMVDLATNAFDNERLLEVRVDDRMMIQEMQVIEV
jgi:hypothetical protein